MTVYITFTTIGTDAGPFNLYSNVDGFASAFAAGVSRSQLLAGFPSNSVPNGTTIVRAKSFGVCTNAVDVPLSLLPPTTTTTSSSSTSTTSTTSSSTTTTTTTAPAIAVPSQTGDSRCSASVCLLNGNVTNVTVYTTSGILSPGQTVWIDAAKTAHYLTASYIKQVGHGELYTVNGSGILSSPHCSEGGSCGV